jgi:hypothetical protein
VSPDQEKAIAEFLVTYKNDAEKQRAFLEAQAKERSAGYTPENLARTMGAISTRLEEHVADCTKYRECTLSHIESVDDRVVRLEADKRKRTVTGSGLQGEAVAQSAPPPMREKYPSFHDDAEELARQGGVKIAASPKVNASPEEMTSMLKPMIESATATIKAEAERRAAEAFTASELKRLADIDAATAAAAAEAKRIKAEGDAKAERLKEEARQDARKTKRQFIGVLMGILTLAGSGLVGVMVKTANDREADKVQVTEERLALKQQLAVMSRSVDVAASAVAAVTAEPPATTTAPAAAPAHKVH